MPRVEETGEPGNSLFLICPDNPVKLNGLLAEIIVVSMADSNEQTDADILQCKADILRTQDIIPPHEKKTHQEPTSQSDEKATLSSAEGETSVEERKKPAPGIILEAQAEQTTPVKEIPMESAPLLGGAGPADAEQEKSEIPKFDLAEEIMAEQRKITSIKRRAPCKKIEAQSREPEVELISYTIEQPTPPFTGQEQIVAEIVSRDIEKLCKRGPRRKN